LAGEREGVTTAWSLLCPAEGTPIFFGREEGKRGKVEITFLFLNADTGGRL